jgi:nucleoid-associated protein YgaU
MRVALGLTLLVGALLLAAAWQRDSLNSEDPGYVPGQEPENDDGWSHLILGEPSGAPALIVDPPPSPRTSPGENAPPESQAGIPTKPRAAIGFTLVVQEGDTLSHICSQFYEDRKGLSLKELIRLVAEHNGLSSVDAIRAGDPLVMPPLPGDQAP